MSIIDLYFEDICRELSIEAMLMEKHKEECIIQDWTQRGDCFVIWYCVGKDIDDLEIPIVQLRVALARILVRYGR